MKNSLKRSEGKVVLIILVILAVIVAACVYAFYHFADFDFEETDILESFGVDTDVIQADLNNSFYLLKKEHTESGDFRTDEQIYMEIVTGKDPGENATMENHCQLINTEEFIGYASFPEVRGSKEAWYVTNTGVIFNATGFIHKGKTYFNNLYYSNKELDAGSGPQIERALKIADAIIHESGYEIKEIE